MQLRNRAGGGGGMKGMMRRPCQECGKRATYKQPKKGRFAQPIRARDDHDLCARCWRKLMDAVRGAKVAA
jgi:hypothetical protein